ncbi:MAG TPA: Bax inhibitor-1/YccA family protein [Gemmatimonadales bacterium]|nr:Bax inhibitor-1/YccA family protein [Gemmatimonadales bacterium]
MSNPYQGTGQPSLAQESLEAERITAFLRKVYGWMFVGLAVTAVVAFYVASSPVILQAVFGNPILRWGLLLGTLGMVWYLSARISEIEPTKAGVLFVVYAGLMGVLLSAIFVVYTGSSIATAFLTAAAMFGALALYGTMTSRSLAGVGQFAFMGLIGVVIASIVGIFWQNDMFQFVLSVCGVIVFTGLTMWDAQRLKAMALKVEGPQVGSYAIVGALALYLDFINLFLFILRLFGRRR